MRAELQELGLGGQEGRLTRPGHMRHPTLHPWGVPAQSSVTSAGFVELTLQAADWVFEAARKLESLSKLRAGWDSYGGRPLDLMSREMTLRVLKLLAADELPTPAVVLGSGGDVHMEWRSRGRELELDLGQDRKILFVKVSPSGDIEEGEKAGNLPEELRSLTRWLMHGEGPQGR